jgi:hypothetical protein
VTRPDRASRAGRGAQRPTRTAEPLRPRPATPVASLPLRHPALWGPALVACAFVIAAVGYELNDPDVWQHLRVGQAIWQTHAVPMTQVWCWPTYGQPQVLPSWGFRALLWPFWQLGGVTGLFVWRWLTTLVALALLWAAARRMGARGLSVLGVAVLASLTWRDRSQVRPEMLVAVLLALEVWILETRRSGGPDRSWVLVAIACAWANVHLSYFLGLALIAIYALDSAWRAGHARTRRAPAADGGVTRRTSLAWVLLAACAASFVNPFGGRALWQPFDYFLSGRHESIYRGIPELSPVDWSRHLFDGLPLLLGGWLLLLLVRALRKRIDLAEILIFALFVGLGLSSQRFLGFAALLAVPFLARDLDEWAAAWRRPAWARAPGMRALLASAACALIALPQLTRPGPPIRVGYDWSEMPVGACDYIAAHDVRGQGFNFFQFGGYLVWRFWPERERLPFMDIHQTGTREDRALLAAATADPTAYTRLMAAHRFDWALLDRQREAQARLLDLFAADSTWAPVFIDDAAVVFVRRDGRLAGLAARDAYRAWPASWGGLAAIQQRWGTDSAFRAAARVELERQSRESRFNAFSESFLGNLELLERNDPGAARHFRAALVARPRMPGAHQHLGEIALRRGHRDEAEREYREELRVSPGNVGAREQLDALRLPGGGMP